MTDDLMRLAVGRPYNCGGRKLPDDVWLNPSRVIAIKAAVMDRSRSTILLEGGHTISFNGTPEEASAALRAKEQDDGK